MRTIGASLVLLGLSVAALVQIVPAGDPGAAALVPEDLVVSSVASSNPGVGSDADAASTTTETTPFTYRVGVLAGISTDNFWEFYGAQPSAWNSYILGPTKPALYRVDPTTSQVRAELAEILPGPSFDGERWFVDVPLRHDLAWSDGVPLTAEDVVFTFETVRSLQLGGSWAVVFPESVVGLEATDAYHLRVVFAERPTLAVWPHSVGTAPIMPEHIWGDITDTADEAGLYAQGGEDDVGGGPLVLSEVTDSRIVSVANPGYAKGGQPDVVVYQIYADESSLLEALVNDQIDSILTPNGLAPSTVAMAEASDGIELVTSPANSIRYLGFNLERDPMSDDAFRQALALLLERETLAESVGSSSRAAYTFVREANTLWHDPEQAAAAAAVDDGDLESRLEQAVAALSESGYAWVTAPSIGSDGSVSPGSGLTIDGLPAAPLTILTPGDSYDSTRPAYVDEIVATLAVLGFEAKPVVTDFDTVVDLAFTPVEDGPRQYDMYLLGWTLGNPSLPEYYRPLFSSQGEMNNTGYTSDDFDVELAAYETAYSITEARSHLWAMEGILARDLPYLVLYTTDITEAYRSDRVHYAITGNLGGIQGRLGGIGDVEPVTR